jgi:hypothetical protein
MNTSGLTTDNKFTVLDLTARAAFNSASSVSFDIGRLWSPEGTSQEKPIGINVLGWIDVHHPCEGHSMTQLRARVID